MNRRTIQLQNAKRERDELRSALKWLLHGAEGTTVPLEHADSLFTLLTTGAAILRAKELLDRKDKANELSE